jgi:type III secretory pathway component EscS
MGSTVVAAVVAGVVGLLVAVGTSVTLVQLQTQTPDPVDKPLVVYGNR